jgi:hypothetical protein
VTGKHPHDSGGISELAPPLERITTVKLLAKKNSAMSPDSWQFVEEKPVKSYP